jgi:hypothetical protein
VSALSLSIESLVRISHRPSLFHALRRAAQSHESLPRRLPALRR